MKIGPSRPRKHVGFCVLLRKIIYPNGHCVSSCGIFDYETQNLASLQM